jgi:hypothetical protein
MNCIHPRLLRIVIFKGDNNDIGFIRAAGATAGMAIGTSAFRRPRAPCSVDASTFRRPRAPCSAACASEFLCLCSIQVCCRCVGNVEAAVVAVVVAAKPAATRTARSLIGPQSIEAESAVWHWPSAVKINQSARSFRKSTFGAGAQF